MTSSYRSLLPRFWRHESGASATEFALVLPVLLMMTFGAIELGDAYWKRASVQWALERAGRIVAVKPNATAAEVEAALNAHLVAAGSPEVIVTQVTDTWAEVPITRIRARYDHVIDGPLLPTMTLNFDFETFVPHPDV
jgi:Flp pilus assembly protein TadG